MFLAIYLKIKGCSMGRLYLANDTGPMAPWWPGSSLNMGLTISVTGRILRKVAMIRGQICEALPTQQIIRMN